MPKEQIHDDLSMFQVEVSWGRDSSHVQVATVVDRRDKDVQSLADLIATGSEEAWETSTGLYCSLSRGQINQLIRTLRRARDQAFGKDE